MIKQKEYANLDNQRTRKQNNNMTNLDFLYRNCDEYILLSEELDVILNTPKLSKRAFDTIIDDNTLDKLSIGDILEKYENFTEQQLNVIKRYIHSHLHDKNPLFVSDLIDCANNNNIESAIIFDFCMDTIKKRRAPAMVLSAIMYVFEHMRITQSIRVVPVLERVVNNKTYYQNCQIIAAFCLFRITMNPQYLQMIEGLVAFNKELQIVLINKMLNMNYNNSKRYFFYYEKMLSECHTQIDQ